MTPDAPMSKTPEEIMDAIVRQLLKEAGTKPDSMAALLCDPIMRNLARDLVASGVAYLEVYKGKAIMCLRCGMISHNPNDVLHRYCGACHEFLAEVQ